MPRPLRTRLLDKRIRLMREIAELERRIEAMQWTIAELDEVIRTKGPYKVRRLNQEYMRLTQRLQ